MTDLITAEEAEKLLDGSTPGPWEWTTGRFSNNPYLSPNILLLAFDGGGPDGVDPNDAANARLIAAAPDLARSVIALHAQLADAQAAQAMVVDMAIAPLTDAEAYSAALSNRHDLGLLPPRDQELECSRARWWHTALSHRIRALAPIDSLALVREAEARGWNNGMLTATSIVAEERNKRNPGPLFEVLNKAVGKIEDTRFAAIRERKQ